jgi:penicillin-binding protein 1A
MGKKITAFIARESGEPGSIEKKNILSKILLLFMFFTIFLVFFGMSSGCWFLFRMSQTLPSLGQMQNIEQPLVSKLLSKNGTLIHEFSIERRFWVSIDKIPQDLQNAVIAIEDRRFYTHWGIDVKRIIGAILVNIVRGGYAQGASTLTQQLARNVYLTAESSLLRKLREALTATQLEACYTKREILELYLNQVYLGAGVYGVEAASEYYFNKHVQELDLNECSVLAGLIQLPEWYRPDKAANLSRITARRNAVLDAMKVMNCIDTKTAKEIKAVVIVSNPKKAVAAVGSYFVEMVRKYVADKYGDALLYNGGLTIHTTMDPVAQDSSERATAVLVASLQNRLNRIFVDSSSALSDLKIKRDFFLANFDSIYTLHEKVFSKYPDSLKLRKAQMAIVALDVKTGAVRTLIGGRNFNESKFNRALHARRQPGSSFKPFVYTVAMENGLTPASVILDQPITLMTPEGEWRPENHDKVFYGPISIRDALAKSVNLVAIQVLNKVGVQKVIECARKMGLKHQMNPVPSLAIGACEVTPIELASAYSIYANGGVRASAYSIEKIVDKTGRVLESHTISETEVLSPQTSYLMNSLLRSVVCCGTGASIPGLGFTRPAAGKTGTTNDYSDAWFIGYTPQIACAVWAGVDERRSLGRGVSGSNAAIPVWVSTMKALHKSLPIQDFERPAGIKSEQVCDESHMVALKSCPKKEVEFFLSDAALDTCDLHGNSKKRDGNMIKLFGGQSDKRGKKEDVGKGKKKTQPLMF